MVRRSAHLSPTAISCTGPNQRVWKIFLTANIYRFVLLYLLFNLSRVLERCRVQHVPESDRKAFKSKRERS